MTLDRRAFLKSAGSGALAAGLTPVLVALPGAAGSRRGPTLRLADHPQFSGIYPHLAFYNDGNECGVGAVVPWAGRLWVVTYSPHFPFGSSDKLYEIDEALTLTVRPESVGGTPANRMIHPESGQLFIGPYAIDQERRVRVIAPERMPGRLTGTARHLADPAEKVYFATMEEGFYEVDVQALEVLRIINPDGNALDPPDVAGELLPGYHGKGLYTGQGRLVYANNGEYSPEARRRPDIPSGALAEWDGETWEVVRRNQFTEVTGPGGISGNEHASDPVWSFGWDHRSALFMLLDGGTWHAFRMPKASHTYDGAHGWHTEWPRIRSIGAPGDDRMLMTMHGMFWDFPKTFAAGQTGGIRPLSSYLKIIGDFCRWQGEVVFGCDDAAASEFAETPIPSAGTLVGQSNSNLWFVDPGRLDQFGPPIGRGGPWIDEAVAAGTLSDPFFVGGFDQRMVHVTSGADRPVTFAFEADVDGTGDWQPLTSVVVPASGYAYHVFEEALEAEWVRVKPDVDAGRTTLVYQLAGRDGRTSEPAERFAGLAKPGQPFTAGWVRVAGEGRGTLEFAAQAVTEDGAVRELGYYEVGPDMALRRVDAPERHQWMRENASVDELGYAVDAASVVVTDVEGRRYRLPKGTDAMRRLTAAVPPRALREVVTERSLFNCQGHLYEVPRSNSGGFAKVRPVATSDLLIMDLCSWRGLLVLSGLAEELPENDHVVRSGDGACALWFGTVDDLWALGKPRGEGGVWLDTPVEAGQTSDPYLMTGYDRKSLELSHESAEAVRFTVEVDITGDGHWAPYQVFDVEPGEAVTHDFPDGFGAYWARLRLDKPAVASAMFSYR